MVFNKLEKESAHLKINKQIFFYPSFYTIKNKNKNSLCIKKNPYLGHWKKRKEKKM